MPPVPPPPVPTPMTWTRSGGYISEHKSQLVLFPLPHFADKTDQIERIPCRQPGHCNSIDIDITSSWVRDEQGYLWSVGMAPLP